MNSTSLMWILSIAFVSILAVGFVIGVWRGLKRSAVNLAFAVVGVIVAFFVTPLITKTVLGITVVANGESSTLQNFLVDIFRSDKDISALMQANPNLETFFINLPSALINVVIFILITVVMQAVLYVFYKILALTCVKIKEDEKKHRVLGGVVGLVKTFLVALIAVMPLASLTGTAQNLMSSDNYGIIYTQGQTINYTSLADDKLPKEVKSIVLGLNNNLLVKISGAMGLDDAMFDYYSSFQLDGEKLYVRKEINNLYKIVDFTYQVSKTDLKEVNYRQVRYDKVIKAIEDTTNSPLFKKVVADTLAELVVNYENYSFLKDLSLIKEYQDIFDNIAVDLTEFAEKGEVYKYFQNDLNKLLNSVKILGQSGIINEILDLDHLYLEDVVSAITNEDNETAFKSAVENILNSNLVRVCAKEIAQKGISMVSSELDKIGASTQDWSEEDWNDFSSSVYNIVNNFGDLVAEVDIFKVLEDFTSLLDESKNYDLNLVTTKLGILIDEFRSNKLLKNADGESIVDQLLEKNNITLPLAPVHDHIGDYNVTIDSYTDYFNFIKNSLILLRDKDVYKVLNNSNLSSKEQIIKIAEIISVDGNEDLLSDIILPLYQVEPTKSLIINSLTNSLQGDLINFASLTNYEEWKKDLGYLSSMLITLNDLSNGTNSYLSLALDGNIDAVINSLSEKNVENVIKPVLYAKSTTAVKDKIFASLKSQMESFIGSSITLSSSVTLIEGLNEDQVLEICEIIKHLIDVDKAFDDGATFKTVDKSILGTLLNTMKINAYRVELSQKEEEGLFKNAFISIVDKFKSEYQKEVEYIQTQPQILAELGIENLNEENYKNINYVQLLNKISLLENA